VTPQPKPAATPPRARRSVALAVLAQLYFTAMFFVAIPWALLWWSGRALVFRSDLWTATGLAVVVAANAVVVALVADFVRNGRGTQVPIDPPRVMIVGGAYRWTRNPMYLAYVIIIFGEALAARWWGIALYALVFWGVFHAYVVLREEPLLRARFGDSYRRYAASVPRWIPHPVAFLRRALRFDDPPPSRS
jgi:protein-S-isoprenylcysteine O-methyltransferase Ste14